MAVTAYNTLRPTPAPPTPARNLSPAALGFALVFALVWPVVLGTILGAIGWFWLGDMLWLKVGFTGGVVLGVLLSGSTLTASALLWRVTAPSNQDMAPATVTVQYQPVDKPREDIRIVPMRAYPITIDYVNGRDMAWFCLGLSRGMSHTQRAWIGKVTPTGQLVDVPFWKALCKPLRRAGLIAGVEPRKAGRVTTRRLDDLLTALGLDPTDPALWLLGDASEVHPVKGLEVE